MSVLRLVQFTDLHLFGGESQSLRGVATLPALRAALSTAQRGNWPPDAILVTGDLVQDDPAGYEHLPALLGSLGLPVLCIPGNHDDPTVMGRQLDRAPFVVGGSVDLAGWRIVLLDSSLAGSASGRLTERSLFQLEEALSSAEGRHCLVALHHHPVPMSSRWLDRVGLENSAAFFRTIDRHENVRAIVWGHVHQAFSGSRRGVRLLGTPSTCAQFLPKSDEFAVDDLPPAFRTLELKPDGTLLTEVVWVDSRASGCSSSVCSAA